jgi:hypothetical protein
MAENPAQLHHTLLGYSTPCSATAHPAQLQQILLSTESLAILAGGYPSSLCPYFEPEVLVAKPASDSDSMDFNNDVF